MSNNNFNDMMPQKNSRQDEQAKQKLNSMINGLSGEQRRQVEQILSDREKTQQLLSTPQAKMLFERLFGNQKQNSDK